MTLRADVLGIVGVVAPLVDGGHMEPHMDKSVAVPMVHAQEAHYVEKIEEVPQALQERGVE
eukprot:5012187-Pyramimonas_sp.AAC.1